MFITTMKVKFAFVFNMIVKTTKFNAKYTKFEINNLIETYFTFFRKIISVFLFSLFWRL